MTGFDSYRVRERADIARWVLVSAFLVLSGAFFPRADQPAPLSLIMSLDPLTYGVAALRTCLVGTPPVGGPSLAVSLVAVVLFGAAETGELVYSAAKTTPIRIVGWVDNDASKHQMRFGEIRVESPTRIESFDMDAVLIASSGKTDEIQRQLQPLISKGIAIVTL